MKSKAFGMRSAAWLAAAGLLFQACGGGGEPKPAPPSPGEDKLSKYTTVRLTTDLDALNETQRKMIGILIEAADAMNPAFWTQAYGDREELMQSISDPDLKTFADINYGPWDRLAENQPFIEGVADKPKGANLYPSDMTVEEFEQAAEADPSLKSLYTLVRRDEQGKLMSVPYSQAFAEHYRLAASKLREAAELAQDPGLRKHLELRAQALLSDEYQASDMAWMDMKNNTLDIVIGPVETYEDQLFGYKAANTAYVLVKDLEWSQRLGHYAGLLPELQTQLPVEDDYKREKPGLNSDLNAYDAVYYAGDCNAGSKTIAINLPNDEQVQLEKGTRRLQLKNAMRAKFDKILIPLSEELIAGDQRPRISFDAFFSNVMFHEVAHGLGIKNTIDGKGTVRQALKERASALEEAKADVLGLFMVTKLIEKDELDSDIRDNFVTFLASIFRSIRFGAASAHGRANLAQFNFLSESGAFVFDQESGTYSVDFDRMQDGIDELARRILTFQGDGDYDGVTAFMQRYGAMPASLRSRLDGLHEIGIPVDIVFEQGPSVLGLSNVE